MSDYVTKTNLLSALGRFKENTDDLYETKADANDLKNAISQLDHRVDNLEQAHGSYVVKNYKDGSITPSGKGAWSIVEGLRGVSRVENNAVKNGDFSQGTSDWTTLFSTLNVVNGVAEITKATANPSLIQPSTDVSLLAGHSYLGVADLKGEYSVVSLYDPSLFNSVAYSLQTPTDSSFMNCSFVYTVPSGGVSAKFGLRNFTGGGADKTFYAKNVGFVDLNIYFGTSDLSFLGATDSAKLATIQTNYPHLLTPSEYGVRIVDSSYSGVRGFSINIWDEVTEEGYINVTTGENVASSAYLRSKNYTPCSPSTSYYLICDPSQITIAILFYNASGGYDSFLGVGGIKNKAFTTPSTASSFRIYFDKTYYNNDVQVCLDSATEKTIYHPHILDTLSLSFQGKSAGSVAEMYYPETGEQTHPIGEVDFSEQSWSVVAVSNPFYKCYVPNKPLYKSGSGNIFTSKGYTIANPYTVTDDKIIYVYSESSMLTIVIRDNSISSASDVTGIMRYEQATPNPSTFVTPIIDNTLLTESGGRMATVQTGTVVDGSFDLGFINL